MPITNKPFLTNTVVCTLCNIYRYNLCVVPETQYPEIARAFDLLGGVTRIRDTNGLVARIGDSILLLLPDTVGSRTIIHESVHLAVAFLDQDADEETFATAVSVISEEIADAIQTLRGKFERAKSRRKRR